MQVTTTDPSPRELLRITDLVTTFKLGGGLPGRGGRVVHAVSGVSLSVREGEAFGLVGESGCGKSTVARTVVGLERPRSGNVLVDGQDLHGASGAALRQVKRTVQMVFQDPYSSLNPRMTVRQLITEAWLVHPGIVPRAEWDAEVVRLLDLVGLAPESADRYPAQFSGGQLQRISIARALAVRPRLLIADEAVSALDVSIQAQVLNLLGELRRELGLALLFISHDLSVVRHLCQRVAVMYLGQIVEVGDVEQIYAEPTHPYTQALLDAVPDLYPWLADRPQAPTTDDDIPSPTDPPSGCRFRTRCWKAQDRCAEEVPALDDRGFSHPSACHFAALPEPSVPQESR